MSWEALGAIAETLGALAVIATLIYLSLQIRQNSRVLSLNEKSFAAQENRERINALTHLNMNSMNSDWYWDVFGKLVAELPDGEVQFISHSVTGASVSDWESALAVLSLEERGRFFFYNLTQWNNCQNLYFQASLAPKGRGGMHRIEQLIDAQVCKWRALGIPFSDDTGFDRYCMESLRRNDA